MLTRQGRYLKSTTPVGRVNFGKLMTVEIQSKDVILGGAESAGKEYLYQPEKG
jgi:hypothetical protein